MVVTRRISMEDSVANVGCHEVIRRALVSSHLVPTIRLTIWIKASHLTPRNICSIDKVPTVSIWKTRNLQRITILKFKIAKMKNTMLIKTIFQEVTKDRKRWCKLNKMLLLLCIYRNRVRKTTAHTWTIRLVSNLNPATPKIDEIRICLQSRFLNIIKKASSQFLKSWKMRILRLCRFHFQLTWRHTTGLLSTMTRKTWATWLISSEYKFKCTNRKLRTWSLLITQADIRCSQLSFHFIRVRSHLKLR